MARLERNKMLLKDKRCIVSGVGPGLGKEIALAFAREGADVALGARTESYLEEVKNEVEALGRRAVFARTDITDQAQCDGLAKACVDRFGGIDVLVHNAFAPDVFQLFEDVDLAAWRQIMDVNLFGSLQLTKSVIPTMKAQGGGSIVFVNSMIIRKVLPLQGGYTTSKGALMTAAQVLAKELGPYKIRVNSIVPGWMWGPSVEGYFKMMERQTGKSVQESYDEIASQITLGEIPPDDDCANAAVFFASDMSSVITGQALDVNGGEVFH
ncbi:MAG: SDR family oxidoreductase [Acidimicrobiia bacterium]|nr:SDR family oxidoreductase [Acidimicrobiia bacterium]